MAMFRTPTIKTANKTSENIASTSIAPHVLRPQSTKTYSENEILNRTLSCPNIANEEIQQLTRPVIFPFDSLNIQSLRKEDFFCDIGIQASPDCVAILTQTERNNFHFRVIESADDLRVALRS